MRVALPLLFVLFALPFAFSVPAEASPSTVRELCELYRKQVWTIDWVHDNECWGHIAGQRVRLHVYDAGSQVCVDQLYQPGDPGPWLTNSLGCYPRAQPPTFQLPKIEVIIQNILQVFVNQVAPTNQRDQRRWGNNLKGKEIVADFYTEISFSDGSRVQAAKGSRLSADSETNFHNVFGEFRYLLKPFRCPFKDQRCKIITPHAGIWDKGTEFVVDVNAQTTTVWVLHGSLEVSDPGDKKTVPVATNQYVTVGNNGAISDPKSFDPRRLSRWWENKTDDFLFLPVLLASALLIVLVRLLGRLADAVKRRQTASSGKLSMVRPLLGAVAVLGAAALPWVSSWSAIPGFGVVRTFQFMDFPFGLLAAGMRAENAARIGAVLLGVLGGILVLAPGASAARRICGLLAALVACAYATLLGVGTVFGGLGPGVGIVVAFVGGLLLSRSQAARVPQPAPAPQTPG